MAILVESFGLSCWHGQPGQMPGAHSHSELEINLVLRGSLTYLFGGSAVHLAQGELAVFWATVPHDLLDIEADTYLAWVTLPLSTFLGWEMPRQLVNLILQGHVVHEPSYPYDSTFLTQWDNDLAADNAERRLIMLLQLEARLRQMALELSETTRREAIVHSTGDMGRVEKIAAYIAQNYASPLTISEIAEAVGVHPNYAMNLFRREFGISIGDFMTRYRLAHAQRLLATTHKGMIEIAFECGFGSTSRFHDAFKKICGGTPARYRKNLRGGAEAPPR